MATITINKPHSAVVTVTAMIVLLLSNPTHPTFTTSATEPSQEDWETLQVRYCRKTCQNGTLVTEDVCFKQNCFPCDCGEFCPLLGTCCPSYDQVTDSFSYEFEPSLEKNPHQWYKRVDCRLPKTNIQSGAVKLSVVESNFGGFLTVVECPDTWEDVYIRENCENPQYDSMETLTPMSDKLTGLVFTNMFCAICHGFSIDEPAHDGNDEEIEIEGQDKSELLSESRLHPWNPNIDCGQYQTMYRITDPSEFFGAALDNGCAYKFDSPKNKPWSPKSCFENLVRVRKTHYTDLEETCTTPGNSSLVLELWDLCRSLPPAPGLIANGARNIFCSFACQGSYPDVSMCVDESSYSTIVIVDVLYEKLPPMYLLFSPNLGPMVHLAAADFGFAEVEVTCPKGSWKNDQGDCIDPSCTAGKLLEKGTNSSTTCRTAIPDIQGLGYHVNFILISVSVISKNDFSGLANQINRRFRDVSSDANLYVEFQVRYCPVRSQKFAKGNYYRKIVEIQIYGSIVAPKSVSRDTFENEALGHFFRSRWDFELNSFGHNKTISLQLVSVGRDMNRLYKSLQNCNSPTRPFTSSSSRSQRHNYKVEPSLPKQRHNYKVVPSLPKGKIMQNMDADNDNNTNTKKYEHPVDEGEDSNSEDIARQIDTYNNNSSSIEFIETRKNSKMQRGSSTKLHKTTHDTSKFFPEASSPTLLLKKEPAYDSQQFLLLQTEMNSTPHFQNTENENRVNHYHPTSSESTPKRLETSRNYKPGSFKPKPQVENGDIQISTTSRNINILQRNNGQDIKPHDPVLSREYNINIKQKQTIITGPQSQNLTRRIRRSKLYAPGLRIETGRGSNHVIYYFLSGKSGFFEDDYRYKVWKYKHEFIDIVSNLQCPFVEVNLTGYSKLENGSLQFTINTHDKQINITFVKPVVSFQHGRLFVCFEFMENLMAEFEQGNTNTKIIRPSPISTNNKLILDISYYTDITCTSISILCLSVTFVTYCLFPSLRSLPGRNNMCLCASLATAQISLLITSVFGTRGRIHDTHCLIHAMILHYSWLASFAWMNTCSIHMFRVFTSNRCPSTWSETKTHGFYCLYSFGIPLLIVISTIAITHVITSGDSTGYNEDICLLDVSTSPLISILTLLTPFGLTMIINTALFFRTVKEIVHVTRLQQNSLSKMSRQGVVTYFKLSTVTGVFWSLQAAAVFTSSPVLILMATPFAGLQGLFIFASFTLTKTVVGLYMELVGCRKNDEKSRNAISSSGGGDGKRLIRQKTEITSV